MTKHSSSSIILCLLCWISFLFLMPNMANYLSQSISRTPLYDNVQAVIDEGQKNYNKQYWEILMEKGKETGVKEFGWWNYDGGDDGFELLYGGKLEVAQAHRLKNMWSEPYRMDMADKNWVVQKDYLDQLIRQQRVQQYLSWLSPSELFGQATDALCRTDMHAFLKYMESQRDYRQTMIHFFTTNNLFASFLYFTPQPEEAFPTEQEMNDYYEKGIGGPEKSGDWSMPKKSYINTDNVPRYVYNMATSADTFHSALGRLTALLAISVILLLGAIVVFMKYDVR